MSLKVVYRDQNVNVPDGTVAVIGADTNATVRVARPGISRRHAIAKYDGNRWIVQDASSRNGTYHDGTRIQLLDVTGPTSIRLGHPSEGELIELEPVGASGNADGPKAAGKPAATATAPTAAAATKASTSTPSKAKQPKAQPSTTPAAAPARQTALPPQSAQARVAAAPAPTHVKLAEDPRLDDLVKALNDTVHSIKGLTWSVWAMIAVTAILALLTLFVGIVAR